MTPASTRVRLDCRRTVKAYEVKLSTGTFSEGENTSQWSAVWDAETLALLEYSYRMEGEGGGFQAVYQAANQDRGLVVTLPEGEETAALPEGVLLELEWPWRSMYLSAQAGTAYKTPLGHLLLWDPELEKSVPGVKEELLRVYPLEKLQTPAGSFETWKIALGREEAAWYESGGRGRVVQYDDGMVVYSLQKIDPK
jgi:hypothetical protein